MKEIITISGREVELENGAAWYMEYKDQFGRDILPALMPFFTAIVETVSTIVSESGKTELGFQEIADAVNGRAMEMLLPLYSAEITDYAINITWAMAKAANPDIDPPKKWVRQFETYPLDEVVPAVLRLALNGSVSSKNLARLESIKTKLPLQP